MTHKTQQERILALLSAHPGQWVPAYTLASIGLRYGSIIYRLRKQGFSIETEQTQVGGTCHSAYRLLPGEQNAPDRPVDALQALLESWHERLEAASQERTLSMMEVAPSLWR